MCFVLPTHPVSHPHPLPPARCAHCRAPASPRIYPGVNTVIQARKLIQPKSIARKKEKKKTHKTVSRRMQALPLNTKTFLMSLKKKHKRKQQKHLHISLLLSWREVPQKYWPCNKKKNQSCLYWKRHQTVWNSSLVYSWNKSAGKVMMWPTLTCFETWWVCKIVPEGWKRRRGKIQAPHPKLCIDTSSASTCYRGHSYSSQQCCQWEENQAAAVFMRESRPSSCLRAGQSEHFWQRFVLHILRKLPLMYGLLQTWARFLLLCQVFAWPFFLSTLKTVHPFLQ